MRTVNFQQRVEKHRRELSHADEAVVDVLLAHPAEAAMWRGEDVAVHAGVHGSAVTRTAKRLGYKGFLELRRDLREFHDRYLEEESERSRRGIQQGAGETILGRLVTRELETLSEASSRVEQQDINRAADLIMEARDVYVFGRGNSIPLSDQAMRRLRRLGRSVHNLAGHTYRDMAERVLRMGSQDVFLVFAFRRNTRPLRLLLEHAEEAGTRVILITDCLQVSHPVPAVVLSAPRGDADTFTTLSVPMLFMNAIVLSISERYGEKIEPFKQRLEEIIVRFEPQDAPPAPAR